MADEKVFVPRTAGGAILRQAINEVEVLAKSIPPEKQNIAIAGVDKDGFVVGYARKDKDGWTFEAQLRGAVVNGKPGDLSFITTLTF